MTFWNLAEVSVTAPRASIRRHQASADYSRNSLHFSSVEKRSIRLKRLNEDFSAMTQDSKRKRKRRLPRDIAERNRLRDH